MKAKITSPYGNYNLRIIAENDSERELFKVFKNEFESRKQVLHLGSFSSKCGNVGWY